MKFDSSISFPNLGIQVDPSEGFTIFNFEVKWYAVIIATGMLLAVIYALCRSKKFGLTSDDIMDIVLVGAPCAIVSARAYYVIFEWERYFVNPEHWYDFLNIRQGGLAIYGAVIGAVIGLTVYYMSKKERRKKLLPAFDIGSIGLLIGQGIGRWGNFMNREAFGCYTDNVFAMRISRRYLTYNADKVSAEYLQQVELLKAKAVEGGYEGFVQVHPTFLYESIWNLAGFVLIHFLSKKRKFDGQVFLYYIAWYGLGRAWIEGLRMDSLGAGNFRASQVLAAVTCVAALAVLAYVLIKKKPDGSKLLVNCSGAGQAAAVEVSAEEEAQTAEAEESSGSEETTQEET